MIRNVIAVIDGAAGSCGKGKVIGEIVTDKSIKISAAITNNGPNAGHTFVDEKGNKMVFHNIPVSSVNLVAELYIGPGSSINPEIFANEYERLNKIIGDRKIYVHERVPLIEERHQDYERKHITSGSTYKGCGAVQREKIMRDKKLKFFKEFRNAVVCSSSEWLERLEKHLNNPNAYVLLEGSQGCDLCLNHSGNYPSTTHKNISSSQMIADSGISPLDVLQTIMVIRPFPIRICNVTQEGRYINTGAYGEGAELKWTQINLASMYNDYPISEGIESLYGDPCINRFLLKEYINNCPTIALQIVFGKNYQTRIKDINNISLLETLEIERLYYKSKGQTIYQTAFLDLSQYEDYPENTIIDQSEQTSVTNLERRIFDLDINKLINNWRVNKPSHLYLNFFQHLSYEYKGITGNFDDIYFNRYLREYLNWFESKIKVEVCALGTGPKNNERILKKEFIQKIPR